MNSLVNLNMKPDSACMTFKRNNGEGKKPEISRLSSRPESWSLVRGLGAVGLDGWGKDRRRLMVFCVSLWQCNGTLGRPGSGGPRAASLHYSAI